MLVSFVQGHPYNSSTDESSRMSERASRIEPLEDGSQWGLGDAELASYPTVFRDDLLKDQVAVISGGGTGIGKAIAFLFARLGAKVIICSRREEVLKQARDAIKSLLDVDIEYQAFSIRDAEAVDHFMEQTWERHGRIDILINNAGGQFPQAALDFTVKGWNAVIDTNLNGSWYMMQGAARRWHANELPGSIVTIVALIWRGMPQVAHTCAARAGVVYLSKTLATEWAPHNIRVNCVAPGSIETEGFRVYPPEASAQFKYANPMHTFGDAYDIAQACVYLSAPSAKFITGEVLVVDGGQCQEGTNWPAGIPDYFKLKY
jgi:NAD(P)-dependent dehydrogenase (short-subunit alcohol dehydrogenase family)